MDKDVRKGSGGMVCNMCGGKTTVTNTGTGNKEIIRSRKCIECGNVFYTSESCVDNVSRGRYMLYFYKEGRAKKKLAFEKAV